MSGDPALEPTSTDRGAERRDRLAGLLQEAREGRREALNLIVADLTPLLWQAVRRQGLGRQAAEDVIQTTWLTFLRNLHAISAPAALIEWLLTTPARAWRVGRRTATTSSWARTCSRRCRTPTACPRSSCSRTRAASCAVERRGTAVAALP